MALWGSCCRYRLQVTAPNSSAVTEDVVIDTTTGYIEVNPRGRYTASVRLIAADSTGNTSTLREWSFTSLPADTIIASNGPNGQGCVHGVQVDGARYDNAFTCNCTGTDHHGDNCEIEDPLPQLRLPAFEQVIPEGEDATNFVTGILPDEADAAARNREYVSTMETPRLRLPQGGTLEVQPLPPPPSQPRLLLQFLHARSHIPITGRMLWP